MATKFFGLSAMVSFAACFWGFAELAQENSEYSEYAKWAAGGFFLGLVSLLMFGLSRLFSGSRSD